MYQNFHISFYDSNQQTDLYFRIINLNLSSNIRLKIYFQKVFHFLMFNVVPVW